MTAPDAVLVRGRVVTPTHEHGVVDDGAVLVRDGRVAWVGPAADAPGTVDVLDAPPGGWVLPGLVDLHCHGGGGASFPDATSAAEVRAAAAAHHDRGTTALLASLVTAPVQVMLDRLGLLADASEQGVIAGIHLEGPFLSPARCGAQDPRFVRVPDAGLLRELLTAGRGHVRTVTMAPELPGVAGPGGLVEVVVEHDAVPSWGHTDAGPAEVARALEDAGRSTATHLFNGMRPWHHRDPGPAGELLLAAREGRTVVELVGDGVHVHPGVVREVVGLVGRDGVALVTDATAAAGSGDGTFRLGTADVVVRDGVARLVAPAGRGALAGSTAFLLDVVRRTVGAGVPVADAVHMASAVPARVLGLEDRGALLPGRRGDMVVTDADLRPVRVLDGA